jgi:predicted dehydrogenase
MPTEIRFGIIGLGLMGREFASAAARWTHLSNLDLRPVLVAVCDTNETAFEWFKANVPTINFTTTNYHELLQHADVDAIYCAVPHHLHGQFYSDIINAGKHLMGEKPFGIDLAANRQIMQTIERNPKVFVRCSSELPFYPGGIAIIQALMKEDFGQIIEVELANQRGVLWLPPDRSMRQRGLRQRRQSRLPAPTLQPRSDGRDYPKPPKHRRL